MFMYYCIHNILYFNQLPIVTIVLSFQTELTNFMYLASQPLTIGTLTNCPQFHVPCPAYHSTLFLDLHYLNI